MPIELIYELVTVIKSVDVIHAIFITCYLLAEIMKLLSI